MWDLFLKKIGISNNIKGSIFNISSIFICRDLTYGEVYM